MLYIHSFSCSKYNSHWLIGDHTTSHKFKCIPIGIHWGERDQWPGKACDQNMTKAGGVMFWRSLLRDSRKFVASSSKVETQWNSLRLKPALSTFYLKNEVEKHLEQKDFKNALKVSRFVAFFYDVFVVCFQCLEEIKSCSGVLLFITLICLFIYLICSSFGCITKYLMSVPLGNSNFCFARVFRYSQRLRLGKHRNSRENKTNCFPGDQTLSAY